MTPTKPRKTGHGEAFEFDYDVPRVQWSWVSMLASFNERDRTTIVGSVGLSGFRLEALAGSYNHMLHHAKNKTGMTFPKSGKLPQVLFVSRKHDGEEVRFRVSSDGKVSIASASAAPPAPPEAGLGQSDGPGTYRRHINTMFDHTAAEAAARRRLREQADSVLAETSGLAGAASAPGGTSSQSGNPSLSAARKPAPKQQARYLDPHAPLLPLPVDAAGPAALDGAGAQAQPCPTWPPTGAHWSDVKLPPGATWSCIVHHDALGRPAGEQWYYLDEWQVPRYYYGPL